MSLINDTLKNINLKELCIIIISFSIVFYILNAFSILDFNSSFFYVLIIGYFAFKLRNSFSDFKSDLSSVFSKELLKTIFIVVLLNIFFSYGMLYLANFILMFIPDINLILEFNLSFIYLNNPLILIGGFIACVLISPISEELIFRGVILNRLRIYIPTAFAVLISSLLFSSLHSYGSIISAFVFAICMAILYLKTENIMVPIFAHFLNNLLAESIAIIDTQNVLFTNDLIVGIMSFLAIISIIIIVPSIIQELNSLK